jgi:hypothetical protein
VSAAGPQTIGGRQHACRTTGLAHLNDSRRRSGSGTLALPAVPHLGAWTTSGCRAVTFPESLRLGVATTVMTRCLESKRPPEGGVATPACSSTGITFGRSRSEDELHNVCRRDLSSQEVRRPRRALTPLFCGGAEGTSAPRVAFANPLQEAQCAPGPPQGQSLTLQCGLPGANSRQSVYA